MIKLSDDAITGDVIAALAESPRVIATNLRVETRQGWVRLTGVVNTLMERTSAQATAESVNGVVSVENNIVVSTDGSISDLETEDNARELLANQGMTDIGVRVEAGTAFLMGSVPSIAVERRAMRIASSARGVRDVISNLEIAAGEPVDDLTLANDVAEALSESNDVDVMNLHVESEDGAIILTGEVTSTSQLQRATSIAQSVPGVTFVENRMVVHRLSA